MSGRPCVGVDAGGSGSRASAVTAAGEVLAEARGPAAAVDPSDPTAAAGRIAGLVRDVLAAAEPPGAAADLPAPEPAPPRAEALVAAVAGAGREEPRRAVEAALSEAGLARRVRVEVDARAAFRHAFGEEEDGVLLVAGTGSVAFARAGGRVARAGGWGPTLGDEGGGFDLARRALRRVARARDGRAPSTSLVHRLLSAAGVDGASDLIDWVARAERREVARLAPEVVRAADAGDSVARRLVSGAVASLASAVVAARRRAGPPAPSRVALSGGLLADEGPLRSRVERRLASLGLEVRPGDAESLAGACLRARELAAGSR